MGVGAVSRFTLIVILMRTFPLWLAVGLAVIASGCGGMFKGKQAAEQGVAEFHKMYNEGKVAQIYAAGHSKLKSATPEKDFLELLGAVQRKLGKVTQTTTVGFNVATFNFTTTVNLTQNTTFEQGTGVEAFAFEMAGGKAVLVGYHINSKDLILK